MNGSVHLAIVQFKPRKGDYKSILARLPQVFSQLDSLDPRPEVAVFAETALTGYFVEGGIRDVAITAGTAKDSQVLTMDVTARTFRYLDDDEVAAQRRTASKKGAAKK